VTTVLYIALGVLVAALVAMQVWIARSQAKMAGDRAGLVVSLRAFNVVLLVAAVGLVAYALLSGK
jgi:hypothetical protein